eukprot:TRINITY_DN6943_c0_g1_i2.p1 TRINITY_DN6943_c0_g1~~TRINITY_DN6943_c0_g1_i2.p1  ORF type:complete len:337 (-),score=56.77 TRINITY_DN6943_c0_g1_i2:30-1040(-)
MYSIGEQVLARQGALIYPAKILHIKNVDDQLLYMVHYVGWRSRWDEWVGTLRLLKDNEVNRETQRMLKVKAADLKRKKKRKMEDSAQHGEISKKKHKKLKNKKPVDPSISQSLRMNFSSIHHRPPTQLTAPSVSSSSGSSGSGTSVKVRMKTSLISNGYDISPAPAGPIPKWEVVLPPLLGRKLIESHHYSNTQKYLITLPRVPNGGDILDEFIESKPEEIRYDDTLQDVIEGIRLLMDKHLGTLLLYRFERPQYGEILKAYPGRKMSEVYGVEHLLRLCTLLPSVLENSKAGARSHLALKEHVTDLIDFINKNNQDYFSTASYTPATSLYIRQAK